MDKGKFRLEFIIEEYKILWDFYKHLMDERRKLFDWFLIIIPIPSTVIAYFVINRTENSDVPIEVSGFLLILVFLIGISFFITYHTLSRTTDLYLASINRIREFSKSKESDFEHVELSNEVEKINFGPEKVSKMSKGSKFFRSLTFIIINSGIFGAIIEVFWYVIREPNAIIKFGWIDYLRIIISFIISFAIHIAIFRKINSHGFKLNKKTFTTKDKLENRIKGLINDKENLESKNKNLIVKIDELRQGKMFFIKNPFK